MTVRCDATQCIYNMSGICTKKYLHIEEMKKDVVCVDYSTNEDDYDEREVE